MGTVVTTELIAEMAEKKWKNPPQNRAEKSTIFSGRGGVLMQAHTDYCTVRIRTITVYCSCTRAIQYYSCTKYVLRLSIILQLYSIRTTCIQCTVPLH